MEVADERNRAAGVEHPLLDLGNGGRRLRQVHGDANHLGAGRGQFDALLGRRARVGRIRHRHRLDDDWRTSAHLKAADLDSDRLVKSDEHA